MSIKLQNVRLAFPSVYQPKANPNFPESLPKYSCDLVMPADSPEFVKFWEAAYAALVETFGDTAQQVLQMILADRKSRCFGDGDERVSSKTMTVYAGYEGMKYIHCAQSDPILLVDQNNNEIDRLNAAVHGDLFYGGCYVDAIISPWIQNNAYGKAIRCNVLGLKFVGDGERFSGKEVITAAAFGEPTTPATAAPATAAPATAAPATAAPAQGATPAIDPATGLPYTS